MVGAVTAAVAAVASIGIEAYGMSQQAGIAGKQEQIANTQLGLQQQQMGMEQSLFNQQQPYRDQLSQLMADPASVSKLPGYAFERDQGAETVARQFAGNPGGGGAAALTRYGEDYAGGAYGQQVQLLAGLAGLNPSAYAPGSNPVGAGANLNNASNNSFNQMQQLLAQGGALTKMFGAGGQFASAGTPASGGVSGAVGG